MNFKPLRDRLQLHRRHRWLQWRFALCYFFYFFRRRWLWWRLLMTGCCGRFGCNNAWQVWRKELKRSEVHVQCEDTWCTPGHRRDL